MPSSEASRRASSSIWARSWRLASSAVSPAIGEPLVEEDADQEGQQSDQGIKPRQRVHHPSSRTRPFSVIEVRVRFDEYRWAARGESNAQQKSPPLPCAVVFRTWYDQVGVSVGELQASPSKRGLHTTLAFDTRSVNEVETSLRHHEQRRDTLRVPRGAAEGQAP